jgi:hypothetical protein
VQVETNDTTALNIQVEVNATVKVALAIQPSTIVFPAFISSVGSTEPLYAGITGSESASVSILSVESANKLIKVEVSKSGFDDNPIRQIRFSVQPGIPVGRFRERVVLKTDNTSVPELIVYVMGEVTGTINVSPKHLPLGTITPGSTVRKTIQLQSAAEAFTFNVLEVSSTVEGMSTELITVTPGKEYQVIVSLPEGSKQTIIRGQIVIKTDDPDQRIITVRVFGRAARQPVQAQPVMPVEPAATGGSTVQ